LKGRDYLKNQTADGMMIMMMMIIIIIKMDFKEVGCEGMDYNDLTQERDMWLASVNRIFNLRGYERQHYFYFLSYCSNLKKHMFHVGTSVTY
jgi:hypothetical protein